MRQIELKEIFFENLQRRFGFDVRGLLEEGDNKNIKILKNHIETIKKVNKNTNRGGETGRKGFNFEYLDGNERKNRYIKEGNNRKVEILDTNDEIIDIKDGSKKLQLKNVSDINDIKFDKYIDGGAKIVVPKDKFEEFKEQIDKKIERAKTPEEKEKFKKWKKNLESSNITRWDAEHPNIYMAKESIKDTTIATADQYSKRMKSIIISHMLKIFMQKIKEIYNNENIDYIQAIKDIFEETKKFVQEVWAKELGKSFVDVVIGIVKQKILSMTKKWKELFQVLLNNIGDLIGLFKKLLNGNLSLKEFLRLALKTIVMSLLAMSGFALEEAISSFIGIPVVGEIIGIILSVGIVSLATMVYSEYIETVLFGLSKSIKLQKEIEKTEEIAELIEQELPKIIKNREKIKIELKQKLNDLKSKSDKSFKKLKDDSLSLDKFEKEFENLGDIFGVKI